MLCAAVFHCGARDVTQQTPDRSGGTIDELLEIMRRLRDPDGGCPWDLQQNFSTIAPYTLEEAYEVVDAIRRNDSAHLCEELGDLLFQVVYHAQMAGEAGWFDFTDVVRSINEKLVRRHPHVFGDAMVEDARAQSEAWEQHKEAERAARDSEPASALDGVPLALPALVRAQKLQQRAARVGFDWNVYREVIDKLEEELGELKAAGDEAQAQRRSQEELGDVLFTCVNLARFLDADAEMLLDEASQKFAQRFRRVESLAADEGRDMRECSLEQLDAWWEQAKKQAGSG
jgi:MazG family protein